MSLEGKKRPEQIPVPEKLYRGFVVDPQVLSVELFDQTLTMGLKNEADPTKTLDGNEAGVYMSDSLRMVRSTNYGSYSFGNVEVPKHSADDGIINFIPLPGCGVIVEVNTNGLEVRQPKISPVFQGHYNNGFEGDEWIADEVPPGNYHPIILTLSLGATDPRKTVIEVNEVNLEEAINIIKIKALERYEKVIEFKTFLESIDERARLNEYKVKKKKQEILGGNY